MRRLGLILAVPLLALLCTGAGFPFGFWKSAAASSDSPVITAQTLGTLRNNFGGGVGFRFTVGGAGITVTELGRWVVSGNSGTHTIHIRNTGFTSLGSVTVNTSGATAGQYVYATLGSPISLSASTIYYIYSTETNAGDQWYDNDTTVTSTSAVTIDNGAYESGSHNTLGGAGHAYVPLNFKYH